MRAMHVRSYGEVEEVRAVNLLDPSPGSGQVTSDVAFAAVGLVDVLMRRGLMGAPTPFVPGLEVTGRVREVGSDVGDLRPGQPVAATLHAGMGGYAERVVAPANLTAPLDGDGAKGVDLAAAAGLGNLTTAYVALSQVAPLSRGASVYGNAGVIGFALGIHAGMAPDRVKDAARKVLELVARRDQGSRSRTPCGSGARGRPAGHGGAAGAGRSSAECGKQPASTMIPPAP